jgi:hypothetical protein
LLLDAGADEKAVNSKGELPWETITGSEGIWSLRYLIFWGFLL